MEHKGPAKIMLHNAVFGRSIKEVRWVRTGNVEPYAQYERSVRISFIEPRKRTRKVIEIMEDNLCYATVEVAGKTVWDSRDMVPCDMDMFHANRERARY